VITKDFLRGRRRRELSPDERDALERAVLRVDTVPARKTVLRRGEPSPYASMLIDGAMCRYMDARDGYRQLVCYHVPGDFVDLHGYPLGYLDHDIATLTECRMAVVPHDRLDELVARMPHLARLLWFSTVLDGALHREWIFRAGRLDATGKLAHFLCETHARMAAIGRVDGGRFALPLTQQDLGEALGLTGVHVNRTLRRLREAGLADLGGKEAAIHDLPALAALGEFVPDYLYLEDVAGG
jgi:CRP-like cAMP-binding protein